MVGIGPYSGMLAMFEDVIDGTHIKVGHKCG